MKEHEPKSVQKTRVTLDNLWPFCAIRQARQEPKLREECVEEILTAAKNSGIVLSRNCLSVEKKDSKESDNFIRRELEALKKQGLEYYINFFIDDKSHPIPQEFQRTLESHISTYGRIGATLNPQYPSQMADYWEKRSKILNTVVKPELEPERLAYEKNCARELAEWEQKHKEWEETPMEKWEELAPTECRTCYGAGTHGTGQSGIGDVYCEDCGGSGVSSIGPSDLRESSEPAKPTFSDYFLEQKEVNLLSKELTKQGIVAPQKEFNVYARFVLKEKEE